MKCNKFHQNAFRYLEHELEGHVEAQFETHLASCLDCQEYLRGARQQLELLQTQHEIEAPDDFHASVKLRILRERNQKWVERPVTSPGLIDIFLKPRVLVFSAFSLVFLIALFTQPIQNIDPNSMEGLVRTHKVPLDDTPVPLEETSLIASVDESKKDELERKKIDMAIEQLERMSAQHKDAHNQQMHLVPKRLDTVGYNE